MTNPFKEWLKEGHCQAHNPNKENYEVWKNDKGFFCETHHIIGGPYISTPTFPTSEEAEAEYHRQAMISKSWKDGKWIGDPDDPDDNPEEWDGV